MVYQVCNCPRPLLPQVKKLPTSLHETDAYKGLFNQVKNFLSACPLVASLKRSKLSHRHWQELLIASATDASAFSVDDVEGSLRLEVCHVNVDATISSESDHSVKRYCTSRFADVNVSLLTWRLGVSFSPSSIRTGTHDVGPSTLLLQTFSFRNPDMSDGC